MRPDLDHLLERLEEIKANIEDANRDTTNATKTLSISSDKPPLSGPEETTEGK